MGKGVLRIPRQLSREETLSKHVADILDADQITPAMIEDLLMDGLALHNIGSDYKDILESILVPFVERDRIYINPYKIALLRGQTYPNLEDFEHLKEIL